MALHSFPLLPHSLQHDVQDGSTGVQDWARLLSRLSEAASGRPAEIAYLPREGEVCALRLHRGGLRVLHLSEPTSDIARLGTGAVFERSAPDRTGHRFDSAGIVLDRSGGGSWILRCWLPRVAAPAQERAGLVRLFSQLAVPLVGSFSLALQLAHGLRPDRGELETTWDDLPYAAMLVTPDLRVLGSNAAAEDLRHGRALFRPGTGEQRLMAASSRVRDEIDEAIHLVCEGAARSRSVRLPLERSDAGRALTLRVVDPRFARTPRAYPLRVAGQPAQLVLRIGDRAQDEAPLSRRTARAMPSRPERRAE